ncbi:MarR family winged helix-turn-helix transcriptional regulator [Variovorax sp. 770b2]|uniref:MarR family winged helix-turn-helix transcriptional regulator n=1 Tax=Variovorax sp. 770b2 TaxID=1566271 RepID=UPI0008E76DE1|nr:MarR family winged helix-turn-helix transcriptional regulator [Variovorax sp. 770b2]SFP26886.1 DNA-binding transcriptional regulator, MarR family [Variovorax sp. 770b2]
MKLELDRYVPGLLLWLSNKIAASASALYRERFDLGVTDWRVLSYFEIYEWSTASQACELMGLDKAAVSRSVSALKEGGWLKSRPNGLRKIEYATTASGKKLHERIIKLAVAREEALLTGFSRQERETLVRSLNRMLGNLEAVQKVGHGDE